MNFFHNENCCDTWQGLDESQEYINKKVSIANERIHGSTRKKPIAILLEEEMTALSSLPALSYEVEEFHTGKIRQDGHVRFRNKYYSVEEQYNGKQVVVIANAKQLSIYHKGKLIEVHNRISNPYITKSTKPSHKAPWERSLQDGSSYRMPAQKIGSSVEEIILKLLMQGNGFIDTRKIWGILSLDKKYPKQRINEACASAIRMESYSYRTIVGLLEIGIGKTEKDYIHPDTSNKEQCKFVRPIEEYNQLLN